MSDSKPVHKRPKVMAGSTYKMVTGCGNLYVMVTTLPGEDEPKELFLKLGKCGSCPAATLEALGRVVSIGLRAGVKPSQYVKTLRGISCQNPINDEGEMITSCIDAAARALEMAAKGVKDA